VGDKRSAVIVTDNFICLISIGIFSDSRQIFANSFARAISLALGERVRVREDSERDVWATDVFPLAFWERVRVRENSERDVVAAAVFTLALGERVRLREGSERDVSDADVFPLALWERGRVREGSERDGVPYGCLFGHGYKEGSVWNRPL